jgi:hypothetical protein
VPLTEKLAGGPLLAMYVRVKPIMTEPAKVIVAL